MIIENDFYAKEAPHVVAKAQEKKGVKNPYISLQSLESLCQGNEALEYSLKEVVLHSLRYAETVCRFQQIVMEKDSNENGMRQEIESLRTAVHDATIDSIRALSRQLRKADKDNKWISQLEAGGRASYGWFAILMAFEVALEKG